MGSESSQRGSTFNLWNAAKNEEWDKVYEVRRPVEVIWYLQRMHPSRTALTACWGAKNRLEPLLQGASLAESTAHPDAPLPMLNDCVPGRNCCLRARKNSTDMTRAFPRQPIQSSVFSSPQFARRPLFHPIWRFRGCCGGTCGGRYARVRRVPRPVLDRRPFQTPKRKRGTLSPQSALGWVPVRWSGYPLGHPDPSLDLPAQV